MDNELQNGKSGISLVPGSGDGSDRGAAYVTERLQSFRGMDSARTVIHLKSDTPIALVHNERNIRREVGAWASTTKGVIRYRIDRDLNWQYHWSNAENLYPAYTAPFTLASLNYEAGVPVSGTYGPKPGVALTTANRNSHYWRGVRDAAENVWHTLTFADDDKDDLIAEGIGTNREYYASDGRTVPLRENPLTPHILPSVTGDAQFYTTPPKADFIPKIHSLTTFFMPRSGAVSFEIGNLYGQNIHYRIVTNPADGVTPYTAAGAPSITLTHADFADGVSYLQCYYAGQESHVETRAMHKNPAFVSGEPAENFLFKDADGWAAWVGRAARPPYKAYADKLVTNSTHHQQPQWDAFFNQGLRYNPGKPLINALLARWKGIDYAIPGGSGKTCARYALEMILEGCNTVDAVGYELAHSGSAIPARELIDRGYYDAVPVWNEFLAYTILRGIYRSDQHADGMTPVEERYLRDYFAAFVVQTLTNCGWWVNSTSEDTTRMWASSRNVAASIIARGMPTYSTPYYGTCGLDGNTTTYPWTPYPDYPVTWKAALVDNNSTLYDFPNQKYRLGLEEYLFDAAGNFLDKGGYFQTIIMGRVIEMALNFQAMHGGAAFPNTLLAVKRAAEGTMIPQKDNPSLAPRQYSLLGMASERFSEAAPVINQWIADEGAAGPQWIKDELANREGWGVSFFNDLATQAVPAPDVSPAPGEYEGEIEITLSTSLSGAEIRYTTNGSEPGPASSLYSGPIPSGPGLTVRARVYHSGVPGDIVTAAYTVVDLAAPRYLDLAV